ncbi:hypothetical protein KJ853_01090 [Patescibacteria group bacterium]|nr:hypothetical protein [Patescibacteria group bacterium]
MEGADRKSLDGLTKNSIKEIEEAAIKNRCWWDMRICPYYFQIKGFQEAGGAFCSGCNRVEQERFVDLAMKLLPAVCPVEIAREILFDEMEYLKEESEERGKKIGREKTEKEFRLEFQDEIKRIIESLKRFINE